MGFMDKAKKFAEQAQKEAKDGTLKGRAKAIADQAQAKLDEVQTQFNDGQKKGVTRSRAHAGHQCRSSVPTLPVGGTTRGSTKNIAHRTSTNAGKHRTSSIVREIALAHGGRAWVEPGPRGGSLFTLALPAAGVPFPGDRRGRGLRPGA